MREISGDDIFYLSAIVDKMDFDPPVMKTEGITTKKEQEQYGIELGFAMFRKMHKAKTEIYQLLESLTGEKMEGKSMAEIMALLQQLIAQEGVANFIKSVVK